MTIELTREDEIKLGPPDHAAWRAIFTEREAEIMEMVAKGYTDPEIGEELHLAATTIKAHLVHCREKIKVRRRIMLARWWWENIEQSPKAPSLKLVA